MSSPFTTGREHLYTNHTQLLAQWHAKLRYLTKDFQWPHGRKQIVYRTHNIGLQWQWLECWWPAHDDEFAYIVEDDVVVSRLWYRWMLVALEKYYYTNPHPNIFGISTQRQSSSVGRDEHRTMVNINVANDNQPFLYACVGSWGQLFFPRHWTEFRLWYDYARNQ